MSASDLKATVARTETTGLPSELELRKVPSNKSQDKDKKYSQVQSADMGEEEGKKADADEADDHSDEEDPENLAISMEPDDPRLNPGIQDEDDGDIEDQDQQTPEKEVKTDDEEGDSDDSDDIDADLDRLERNITEEEDDDEEQQKPQLINQTDYDDHDGIGAFDTQQEVTIDVSVDMDEMADGDELSGDL